MPICIFQIRTKYLSLTNDSGLKVDKDGPGNVFSCPCLTKEGTEGIIPSSGPVIWYLSIWLDPMFQTVQLPARITNLSPSLAHMNGDALTLQIQQ